MNNIQALELEDVDYIQSLCRLWQEWLCIMWLVTQNMRLNYQEQNQKALRADTYRNVKRVVDSRRLTLATRGDGLFPDDHNLRVGVKILSRSFVGSPRWYHMHFIYVMAICHVYHKPDYFITMTCNPKWEEIQKEQLNDQNPEDWPDITVAVFKQKVDALMNDLVKGSLFGKVAAHLSLVEFKK